jgi:hypothetical protein
VFFLTYYFNNTLILSYLQKMAEVSLEEFNMWRKVPLQVYLKARGLHTTGTRPELAALAFAAQRMNMPKILTTEAKDVVRSLEYKDLLMFEGTSLPDPRTLETGWQTEAVGKCNWPCCMITDISDYLRLHETDLHTADLRKRLLFDYKEGKAFSYFSSQFLVDIFYHPIRDSSPLCFLKADCVPSYAVNDSPHEVWCCLHKKTGVIQSTYCTCYAG